MLGKGEVSVMVSPWVVTPWHDEAMIEEGCIADIHLSLGLTGSVLWLNW